MGVGDDVAPRFTQKPALRQEDGGKKLVFQCVLEASPQPEIAWFRGTTPLTASDRIGMRVESAGGAAYNVIMEILGVTQGDAGTYKVTAKNRLGEVSASINLNFSAGAQKQQDGIAPNFIQKPVTRQENNGQKLLFECVLTADPAPAITWFKDNAAIAPGGRFSVRAEPRDNKTYFLVLEINGVNAQDAGNYKVTANNALGESNATIRLNFDTSEVSQVTGARPVFLQKPAIRQVGDKIVLECKLTADPKPQVSWIFNNQPISFGPGSRLTPKHISEGSTHTLTLEIAQVSMNDAGEYRAYAKNDVGEATATITLSFEGAKKPELPAGKAPHFTQKPTIKQQQKLLILTCLLEANPTPQIRWFRDSTEVGAGGRYSITLQRDPSGADLYTAVLQITDPKQEDGGTYKCTAANDFGESNANITLNFAGGEKAAKPPGGVAPTFTEKPKVSQDASGKNIIITCQCTANPKPEITWFKGTTQLQSSARIVPSVVEEGNKYTLKMEVLNFTKEDGGQYKVTAKNEMGEGSANITINLEPPKEPPPQPQGKPSIRLEDNGKMIVIQQAISSASKPTALWYFGNTPVGAGDRLIPEVTQEGNLYYLTLKIPNFTDKDSGTYKLVMKNNGGEATTTASVNVDALKPKPKGEGPKVTQKLNPQSVNDGDAVEFVVKVTGTEPLDIQWSKDGKVIASSDIYSVTYDKGTCRLYIPEVFPEDSGNYSVNIKNQWGNASSTASLQVKEPKEEPKQMGKSEMEISVESKSVEMQMTKRKVSTDKGGAAPAAPTGEGPFFKKKPVNQVIVEGDNLKMNIEVALDGGKPMPNVRYLRAGREIREDSRVTISTNKGKGRSTLEIRKVKITDEAKYTVNLEQDGVITDTAIFSVFVKDPKDSNLDFRSLLKHRDVKKTKEEDEDPDWGNLKPDGVDKGRRESDIDATKINLKKVEKPEIELPEKEYSEREMLEYTRRERTRVELEASSEELSFQSMEKVEKVQKVEMLQKVEKAEKEPDKFTKELQDAKAKEGDKVEFVAEFTKPNATLRWFKNKLEVFHGHKFHFVNNGNEYKLVIPCAKPEDGGKVTIECDGVQSSAWLYVDAAAPDYHFTQKLPEEYDIKRKKSGMLECFVSDPRAFVKWFRNGKPLEYTPGKYEIQRRENRCILRILDAQPDDAAEYSCKCDEAVTACKLRVGEPEWEFMKPLDDVEAVEREKALMECDVSDPEADVSWWRGEKIEEEIQWEELKSGGKYEFLKDGLKRKLQIKNCSSKDDGKYTCKLLDQTTTAELYVSPDVKFIKKLVDKKCKEKEQIVLDVKATNPHKHPVKWLKDGKPVPDTIRFDTTQKGEIYKLTIKDTDFGDSGEYSLLIGQRATRGKLTVEPTPRPPKIDASKVKEVLVKKGENICVEIPYDGAPVPRAKWTKNGEPLNEANLDTETVPRLTKLRIPGAQTLDNGQYELTLTNDAGSDKVPVKITVMGPPSPPKGPLDVVDVYCDRCALIWDKPTEDGGSPVTHYVVEKCDQETGDWEKLCETGDLEADVPNLVPGHRYMFRVSAVNAEGASDFLKSDGAVLAKDPWGGEPDHPTSPPGNPEILDYDKDYAEIGFAPPEKENGAPVQGYLIEYRQKGDKDWKKGVETKTPDNKGTVEGLTEGKEYEFRAMARNKAGLSEPSTVSPPVFTRSRKVKPRIDQPSLPKNVRIKVGQKFSLPVKR